MESFRFRKFVGTHLGMSIPLFPFSGQNELLGLFHRHDGQFVVNKNASVKEIVGGSLDTLELLMTREGDLDVKCEEILVDGRAASCKATSKLWVSLFGKRVKYHKEAMLHLALSGRLEVLSVQRQLGGPTDSTSIIRALDGKKLPEGWREQHGDRVYVATSLVLLKGRMTVSGTFAHGAGGSVLPLGAGAATSEAGVEIVEGTEDLPKLVGFNGVRFRVGKDDTLQKGKLIRIKGADHHDSIPLLSSWMDGTVFCEEEFKEYTKAEVETFLIDQFDIDSEILGDLDDKTGSGEVFLQFCHNPTDLQEIVGEKLADQISKTVLSVAPSTDSVAGVAAGSPTE